jgi:hypothetical protein
MDVHTHAPFTQRFTPDELKLHRDSLCKLVADGKVSADDEEAHISFSTKSQVGFEQSPKLIPEAINLLISVAQGDGFMLEPSAFDSMSTKFDRAAATHQAAFDQMCECGFLKFRGGSMYVLTLDGFNAADAYLTLINAQP